MAFIGMRHVVAAEVDTHVAGSEPTYKAGFDVGKAIQGNLNITRNDNPLYADDVIAEDDNSITAMELELGVDDLLEDTQVQMGLLDSETSSGTSPVTIYYENAAPSKPLGVGYIRIRRKNNSTVYQAVWIYKLMFSLTEENSQTKGESIEWQTPTINGKAFGLDTGKGANNNGDATFRKKQNFTTEAAAEAYLDGLAGISRT